ncbi:MAG: NAD(P)-binding domain-containing protein [Actinomycetota bacterium]
MSASSTPIDVLVIGAGQAGLSTAHHLARLGLGARFVVLDGAPGPGGAWRNRWDSLTLGRAHGVHDLPGLSLADAVGAADADRPASEVVEAYFGAYERHFDLPVRRPVRVRSVRPRADGRLVVRTVDGDWAARALVNATGTWDKPFWPAYPGRETFTGRQLHTADYRSSADLAGAHVVVVGGGASAVQLLIEISAVATTTWVTRREPLWRSDFTPEIGREAVALVEQRVARGLPPGSVVSVTGLALTPDVRVAMDRGLMTALPVFDRIVPSGVVWERPPDPDRPLPPEHLDADVILWCTGFRPALDHLAPLQLREIGGGITMVGTRTARDPRVHLVGYGPSASTIGATRAGRVAAVAVRDQLREPVASGT